MERCSTFGRRCLARLIGSAAGRGPQDGTGNQQKEPGQEPPAYGRPPAIHAQVSICRDALSAIRWVLLLNERPARVIAPPDRKRSNTARRLSQARSRPLAFISILGFLFFLQQNVSGRLPTSSLWGGQGVCALGHALETSGPRACARIRSPPLAGRRALPTHSALLDVVRDSGPGVCPRGSPGWDASLQCFRSEGTAPCHFGSMCLPSSLTTLLRGAWMDGSSGRAREVVASSY